jgi:hypothetical protein
VLWLTRISNKFQKILNTSNIHNKYSFFLQNDHTSGFLHSQEHSARLQATSPMVLFGKQFDFWLRGFSIVYSFLHHRPRRSHFFLFLCFPRLLRHESVHESNP